MALTPRDPTAWPALPVARSASAPPFAQSAKPRDSFLFPGCASPGAETESWPEPKPATTAMAPMAMAAQVHAKSRMAILVSAPSPQSAE